MTARVFSKYSILWVYIILLQGGWLSLVWPMSAAAQIKSAPISKSLAHTGPGPSTGVYLHYDLHAVSNFVSVIYNLTPLCHLLEKPHDGERHLNNSEGKRWGMWGTAGEVWKTSQEDGKGGGGWLLTEKSAALGKDEADCPQLSARLPVARHSSLFSQVILF